MKFFHTVARNALLALACVLPLLAYGENPEAIDQGNSRSNFQQFSQNAERPGQNQCCQQNREAHDAYAPNYAIESRNCCPDYNCCEPCNPCENRCGWDQARSVLFIGAAAILGGVIGGEICNGRKRHRGHDGDDGYDGPKGSKGSPGLQGPQGPGFTPDIGQTLTFFFNALVPAPVSPPPGTGLTLIPFVTAPDGVTTESPAVVVTVAGAPLFASIVITNPVFGFYNFGFSIKNPGLATLTGITLNGSTVQASRDGSTTIMSTPAAATVISPGESQVDATFTYDRTDVP
jgi:hypothetical protein